MGRRRRTIAVVGAGPCGSAAAIAALRADGRADVLLLDKHDFPRDKACGDGVAAHVLEELSVLGLEDAFRDRRPARSLAIGSRSGSSTRAVRIPIYGIPRTEFDAELVRAAVRAGADLRREQVRTVFASDSKVIINGSIEADVLIGADGVESVVRTQLGLPLNPHGRMALAIRGYTPSTGDAARLVSWGRGWPAYAWEFPLGNGTSNVGYGEVLVGSSHLTREHLLTRLDELLPGVRGQASRWRGARIPLSTYRPVQPDGRVLLAGDAASLVNPMSGEGIWYAVRSGRLAGEAAVGRVDPGAAYRASLRTSFRRHLRHANAVARIGSIGGLAEFGTRMAGVHEAFFHDQVAVSVGGGTYSWLRAARAALTAATREWPSQPGT